MGIDISTETGTDGDWSPARPRARARTGNRVTAEAPVKGAPDHYTETGRTEKDPVTQFLGWFSVALGAAEIFAPGGVARAIGIDEDEHRALLRVYGLREMAAGVAILSRPKPTYWMWNRVIGDAIDLTSLAKAMKNPESNTAKLAAATVAVLGVTALDIVCATRLARIGAEDVGRDEGSFELPKGNDGQVVVGASVTVNKPVEEVYAFWKDQQNYPRFMSAIDSVKPTSERRARWKIEAPAGLSVEWDAEIVNDTPNEMISWRSVDASPVQNTGTVRFRRAAGERGTEVQLEAEYRPKGGPLGAKVAEMLSAIPKTQLAMDLRRFKQLIELGEVVKSDASAVAGPHPARPPRQTEMEARQ
ncbi:MAG TPA: SRPBCC family protein [Gemmatimonadaceae bacterium]